MHEFLCYLRCNIGLYHRLFAHVGISYEVEESSNNHKTTHDEQDIRKRCFSYFGHINGLSDQAQYHWWKFFNTLQKLFRENRTQVTPIFFLFADDNYIVQHTSSIQIMGTRRSERFAVCGISGTFFI